MLQGERVNASQNPPANEPPRQRGEFGQPGSFLGYLQDRVRDREEFHREERKDPE